LSKLVIHIGLRKTGSSALQELCARNRDELRSLGIEYPESLTSAPGHQELAWMYLRPRWLEESGKTREAIFEHLSLGIASSAEQGMQTLLSSEDLSLLSLHALASRDIWRSFRSFAPRIVFYRRDPVDYHVSNYVHAVVAGRERREFRDYVFQARNLGFAADFMHRDFWGATVGHDNLQVLDYDAERFASKSIYADFIEQVFGRTVDDQYVSYRSNTGVSAGTVDYFLTLNRSDLPDEEIRPIKRRLQQLPLPRSSEEFLDRNLTRDELRILREIYR